MEKPSKVLICNVILEEPSGVGASTSTPCSGYTLKNVRKKDEQKEKTEKKENGMETGR